MEDNGSRSSTSVKRGKVSQIDENRVLKVPMPIYNPNFITLELFSL